MLSRVRMCSTPREVRSSSSRVDSQSKASSTRTAGAKLTDFFVAGRCEGDREEDMMEVRVPVDTEGGCLARTFCLLKDLMVLLPDLGETMDGAFSGMTDAGMLLFVWDG